MIFSDDDADGMDGVLMSVAKPQAPSEGGASKEAHGTLHVHIHIHEYT